jgi:hypothetical protein
LATIREIIDLVDTEKPNPYTDKEKVQWIINCEMQIARDIFKADAAIDEDDLNETLTQPLMLTAPFEDVYEWWLMSQIDMRQGEYSRYNNEVNMFAKRLEEATAFYLRNNKQKPLYIRLY